MNTVPKTLKGIPLTFDYKYLDQDQLHIRRETLSLRVLVQKERSNGKTVPGKEAFAIAKILIDIKSRLPEALFLPWLVSETYVTKDIAVRYMKVAKVFEGKEHLLGHVPVSILYKMTFLPSSHPLLNRAESGYTPTTEEVNTARSHDEETPSNQDKQSQPYETVIQNLSSKLDQMQQQIKTLTPELQIKEVVPQEILEELNMLREQNERIAKEHNVAVERLESLQKDHEKVTKEKQVLSENYKALFKRCEETKGKHLDLLKRFNEAFNRIYREDGTNVH